MSKLRASVYLKEKSSAHARYTCNVKELIEHLSQYKPDMPVLAEWEGTIHGLITPEIVNSAAYNFEKDQELLVFSVEI